MVSPDSQTWLSIAGRTAVVHLRLGSHWQEHGLGCTAALGTPLDAHNVVRHFHHAVASAGLPRRSFHHLRHAVATFLLATGCDICTVQQVLGHAQVSLTADLYAHVMPTLLADAAHKLDAILAGSGSSRTGANTRE